MAAGLSWSRWPGRATAAPPLLAPSREHNLAEDMVAELEAGMEQCVGRGFEVVGDGSERLELPPLRYDRDMIDLDAYFSRIGYGGPRNASLDTLRAIHALHPAAIPFENLDPLLGRSVPLDLAALQEKMLHRRRGGYCFEQNALFKAVLEALGFAVTGLAARVRWRLPPDAPANPRTHMLLKLDLTEGSFIADVGFGGLLFAAPLKFVADIEQGQLRLQQQGDGAFTVQARLASGWQDAYRFTLEQQFPADYEVANWFTAAHPNSRFRNNLLMERLTPSLRLSLFNHKVTRRFADERVEETTLADAGSLARVLADEFEIEPPVDAASVFARLPPA